MEFLKENNIQCFKHPATSPDLNPIENIWSILKDMVYKAGKIYKNLEEL